MKRKYYSLIDKVHNLPNLVDAFKRVKRNKGAPGVDGETVLGFAGNLKDNLLKLHSELKTNTYQPQPVKRILIEKPDGGQRPLGIPTVRDRVVQQALKNVLEPIFDPHFHENSFGYRPRRSTQKAVAKAHHYLIERELEYVVDMDLSKCFDTLDHEIIINCVAKRVSDGKVLKLIRAFLKSGLLSEGTFSKTEIGSPQGGVISPLLMNIYLDEFDQEMKKRGIKLIRYADDILLFADSRTEAGKIRASAAKYLESVLLLRVNKVKTHMASLDKGVSFLGFKITRKYIIVEPKRLKRLKDKIRKLTPRNHGKNIKTMIKELNPLLRGWINYVKLANCKNLCSNLMSWIRRRLRMKKMKEWKSWKPLHKQLRRNGYHGKFKKISMTRWRNSSSPLLSMALPNEWFKELGLFDLTEIKVGVLHLYKEKK